jgi:hypothetical protein
MILILGRRILPLLLAAGASAQEAPNRFQLTLPDFFETPFPSGVSIVDLPDRPIRRMSILISQAFERNITSSSVRVLVNGKGIGNILEARSVAEGMLLTMDPSLLSRRPDELFDPRENAIEITASDSRQRRYYQSWIVRTGVGQNPYFAYSASISPDDPRGAPPDLILDDPAAPPVFPLNRNSIQVTIKGTCSSARPPTQIVLNGKPLLTVSQKIAGFQQTVDVNRGTKELTLEASDAGGNRRTVVIPVIVQQPNRPVVHFAGAKYAVVIGISRYGAATDAPPPLATAAADAAALATQLEQAGGFHKENVRILLDDQATLPQIRTAFYDFASKATANDLLVVYVNARGLHDPRPGKGDRLYLAPFGTRLSQIDATTLSLDDLEMLLSKSVRSNHTFLIFDVGHHIEGDWKFPGRSLVNNRLLNLFSGQEGWAVLVSGSADEDSHVSGGGSGVFGHWLARGLAGEADLNLDRVVTSDELFRFVSEKVRVESSGAQNPRYRLPRKNADQPLGGDANSVP